MIRAMRFLLEILAAVLVILLASAAVYAGWLHFYRAAYPVGFEGAVREHSAEQNLDPALVYAVIRTESGFNPAAQSQVPARGLMQITEDTFEWTRWRTRDERQLDYDDLFDAETNIRCGTALLRLLLDEFQYEQNALCAYHAGRSTALRWLADPDCAPDGKLIVNIPYGDTGRYVKKVLKTRDIYEQLYASDNYFIFF